MKKLLIMLITTVSLFAECALISSPYTNVEDIEESSFYAQHYYSSYRTEDGKWHFRDFSEAYILFVNALSDNAKKHCLKNGYNGVYNVKISHSTAERNGYYFTGSVDYVKLKEEK